MKFSISLPLIFAIFLSLTSCKPVPEYTPGPNLKETSFEEYYTKKLARSKELNVRPGNEEKWIQKSSGKTPLAILYIHGYSASRAEGEEVVDQLSDSINANTYYLRLPGHGTNSEDHRDRVYSDYLEEGREALMMTKLLGEKVIVIGTSMGGLISTYLAAQYPEDVYGLILASPFYDFEDKTSRILNLYGGINLTHLLFGKIRDTSYNTWKPELQKLSTPEYDGYWTTKQYYEAILPLNDLRRAVSNESTYEKVKCPTLLMYYYKNEMEKDKAVSVEKMISVFQTFPSTKQSDSTNKLVKIEEGNHILLSKHIQVDKTIAKAEMEGFLKKLLPAEK